MGVIVGLFKLLWNVIIFAFQLVKYLLHSALRIVLGILYIPSQIIQFSKICTFGFIYIILYVLFAFASKGGNPFKTILLTYKSGMMFRGDSLKLLQLNAILTLMITIILCFISYKIIDWYRGVAIDNREMFKSLKYTIGEMKSCFSYIEYGSPKKEEIREKKRKEREEREEDTEPGSERQTEEWENGRGGGEDVQRGGKD